MAIENSVYNDFFYLRSSIVLTFSIAAYLQSFVSGYNIDFYGYLRNKFNFWKVRVIMNTSGLLQSK